ncbi:MAG: serine/threonine-protein kinase [Patulibacter minatonensis]
MSGDVLIGRYELGERIGSGGMARVVRAQDRRLERTVAVKLLAEHLADDPQFVQRFEREAKSAARLVHPNIVQVFDYGFDPDKGRYYIVMEYVQGRSGAQLLQEHGRLSVDTTLHLADGACRALTHAHRHGVIHRDVKPGNLMLSDDGQVKLTDFGIAWAGDSLAVTQHGAVLGTVAYLAPEQATGDKASPLADVYGLGVVIFQMMTGRLPFAGQTLSELVLAQRDQRPPPLDRLVNGVPRHVAQAVERAIAFDPTERPQSAQALHAALFGDDTAVTRLGAAADATDVTRLGDQTGVTRITRRGAMTGARPAAPAPAAAPAAPVQRLQPRAAERDWPPGAGEGSRPPVLAPAGRAAKKRSGGGAKALRTILIGAVMAAAGAGFGYWVSDEISKTDFSAAGGDLPGIVQNLSDQLNK